MEKTKERDSYNFSIQFVGIEDKGFVPDEKQLVVIDEDEVIDSFNRGVSEISELMTKYFYTRELDLIRDANDVFYNGYFEKVIFYLENKISSGDTDYIIHNPPYHREILVFPSGDTTLEAEEDCLNSLRLVPEGKVPVFKIFIGERIPTFEEVEAKKQQGRFRVALENVLSQDGGCLWITKEEWNRFLKRTEKSETRIKKITHVGLLDSYSVTQEFLAKKRGLIFLDFDLKHPVKISSVEELKILLGLLMYRQKSTKAPSWQAWRDYQNDHFFWSASECLDGSIDMVRFRRNVFAIEFGKNI